MSTGWIFLVIFIVRLWMAYQNKQAAGRGLTAARQAVPRGGPHCARCGSPYDLSNYRPDAAHIYCSHCHEEIPRSAVNSQSDDAFTMGYYLSPTPERVPEVLERSLKYPWFNDAKNTVAWYFFA